MSKDTKPEPIAEGAADGGSAQTLAEKDLAASELRYRRLFESAKDGILILDAETGIVVDVNPFLLDLLDYPYENFVGKAIWELGFFRDIVANQEHFTELQQKQYIRYEDKPLKNSSGKRHEVEFISNVYLVNGKKVIQCNIRDITDRKLAESYRELGRVVLQILNEPGDFQDAIRRVISALKTQTGFDAVAIRLQEGDDFPYFNQEGFSEEFLRTENSLTGRNADGGVCRNKDGTICLECTCGLVLCGRTDPANPFFTPGGSFWTNDSSSLLHLPAGSDPRLSPRNECIHQGYTSVALIPIKTTEGIVGLMQFNDRHPGCFTLETVELLEGIAAQIGAAVMRRKREDQIEILSRFPLENPNPVLRISFQSTLEYANAAAEPLLPALGAAKPGEPVNAEWRGHIDEAIANGRPIAIEIQTDGLTFDATLVPVADHGYVNLYARNITEQRKMVTQLRQAQKMESVGRLAGGVAHDFNNMLQIILGHTELALGKTTPADPLFASLKEIQAAAGRSGDLTRQLLAFAREQPIAPVILNLNDEISKTINMLRRLLREEVALVWQPGTDLHLVKLDPSQIDQILVNLCINAQDAIPGSGKIIIETRNVQLDESYCAGHAEAVPGDYIALTVSDTGDGMNKETLKNIFEPFYTTKEVGKGTGLGLSTVYGIVKQNGGFIYVYSEPEHGTTFKIHLLETVDAQQKSGETGATAPPLPEVHNETVLLVEDEPALRNLYNLLLTQLGYTVLTAQTAPKALDLFSENRDGIQLLITDVVMPGMNGKELSEAIRAVNPSVKILFMSGYTADVIVDRGLLEPNVNFIAKPFSCGDLARKVRNVLEPNQPERDRS